MHSPRSSITLLVLNLAFSIGDARGWDNGWSAKNFKNIVTFGDSYTDENRLGYFINHKSAPPVGWEQPIGLSTSTGGLSWPRYASIYSNTTLYNYAVSGAVCSNQITPRWFSAIDAPFPDIANYELPAFLADSKYVSPNGTKFFTGTPDDTVYAIWIGTNDLGNNAFLTDSQTPGKTLTSYLDCVYATLDTLYHNGARSFILLNLAPLQLLPQYATPANGGLAATQYFPDKPANITEISWRMYEAVATVNAVYAYRTPFETVIQKRWPEAQVANFDVNGLITDMWSRPAEYLNGSAEANVKGYVNHCTLQGKNCTKEASPDSFLWYDELHPSEQADRVVAREFVGVMEGGSKWAKYWG
ncbi:hypothetical protein EJ04DRAFT_513545 [Polyplosphaeria fusca]|uniref:Carbohydrate esterase family 16 protein n=1 Tax=Polyplosphaeria fusca TaxID=682080 RepID=A0A9P4V1D5_9PLEO|nr:hypothetical protein EJ04DRAFT_513545 [Polyplosphaeria fusca]